MAPKGPKNAPRRPNSGPLAPTTGPPVVVKAETKPRRHMEPQELEGGSEAVEALRQLWSLESPPEAQPQATSTRAPKRSGPLPRKPIEGPPWGLYYRHRVLPARGAEARRKIGVATAKRIVNSLSRADEKVSVHDEFHDSKTIALARKKLPIG